MICSPLLAKPYFPRHRGPAFTDCETRGRLCFFSWSTIMVQEENVPRVHVFTSRIQVDVRGQGFITCNRDWWEGVWGEVICHKTVQQSFLNQSLDPPPIKNSWIPPVEWELFGWSFTVETHYPTQRLRRPLFCSHYELLGFLRVITKMIQLNLTATSISTTATFFVPADKTSIHWLQWRALDNGHLFLSPRPRWPM